MALNDQHVSEQGLASSELFTPEFSRDPSPTNARLRAEHPICTVTSPRFDSFFITRYDDVKTALTDPRLSKDLYGPSEAYLQPEQLERLLQRPDVLPSAVAELLRFDGSVPVASPPYRSRGRRVPRSAHPGGLDRHDRARRGKPRPRALLRLRRARPHSPAHPPVAFGHGIHFCHGVSLARMEAQIALSTLLRRLPDLTLAVAPEQLRRPPAASPFRGLLELPVTFSPRAGTGELVCELQREEPVEV